MRTVAPEVADAIVRPITHADGLPQREAGARDGQRCSHFQIVDTLGGPDAERVVVARIAVRVDGVAAPFFSRPVAVVVLRALRVDQRAGRIGCRGGVRVVERIQLHTGHDVGGMRIGQQAAVVAGGPGKGSTGPLVDHGQQHVATHAPGGNERKPADDGGDGAGAGSTTVLVACAAAAGLVARVAGTTAGLAARVARIGIAGASRLATGAATAACTTSTRTTRANTAGSTILAGAAVLASLAPLTGVTALACLSRLAGITVLAVLAALAGVAILAVLACLPGLAATRNEAAATGRRRLRRAEYAPLCPTAAATAGGQKKCERRRSNRQPKLYRCPHGDAPVVQTLITRSMRHTFLQCNVCSLYGVTFWIHAHRGGVGAPDRQPSLHGAEPACASTVPVMASLSTGTSPPGS